jgi:hydrogenase nickel incorporation protein HypA/HybF
MHELAVTKSILKLVLDHTAQHGSTQVLKIHLVIGEMRNLEEDWIQRYFDYISKGTPAEKSVIKVKKVPVEFLCSGCGRHFTADVKQEKQILCPHCDSFEYDLVAGRELIVEKIEVR